MQNTGFYDGTDSQGPSTPGLRFLGNGAGTKCSLGGPLLGTSCCLLRESGKGHLGVCLEMFYLQAHCQDRQSAFDTLSQLESKTVDDIIPGTYCRSTEPREINSFPLSGPAGSPVCQ